ncbi:MAG: Zn-ribbon domain-containing OB-fold protein [Comamonadaceae bacterium]|nr:MAG: Zn-ribbon domain-containing OB-fold protein [Comamonadaceae bacterium]
MTHSESTADKPLPVITDLTRPFWTAAKHGRLVLQKCQQCGTFNFHPKPWCIECGSRALAWVDAQPGGTVYSHTVSRSVAMNFQGWGAELPVILCLVDLDDGARMYAQVTDCDPADIRVGMRVEVYFESISDEAGIPKFRPAGSAR